MSTFSLFGVNLSGAEYNSGETGVVNFDYTYPTDAEIDYFASQGMTAIRLPFLLERLEPVANGPLDPTQLSYIDAVVNYAATKGISVILDPHDYGDEYGTVIGTTAASNATFANFWGQVAAHYASTPNVLFGLMNEPNAVSPSQWIVSVNAAIAAIRAAGATSQQILVPGVAWDGAASWVSSGNAAIVGAGVVDPSHNFAFEVHQYLDSDGSGTHSTVVSTTIGVSDLTAITQWAEATGNKLFLGEFGVASDPTSLTALGNMLGYMAQHTDVWEGGTYWAAGAWLGNYMYSANPTNGVAAPQTTVLDQYTQTMIASNGPTSLTELGSHYFLNSAAGSALLQNGGVAVVAGQPGSWAPIAELQTATGYEVVMKIAGANQYTVWNTDSNGNFVSDTIGTVSGTSTALESLETSFNRDLNGDGVIGVPTVIEAFGSTSLIEVGSQFYLSSGGAYTALKYGGATVVAGQFAGWTPIAVEQTASGYEVAWKGPNQDTVWTTDSNGNEISSSAGMSGSSAALESYETNFHYDLNGDGVIGVPTTVIQTDGSTSLAEVGTEFYLYNGGSGPVLQYNGAPVVAGQFANWAPIGAVQTSSGYEIAWKGPNQFTVWTTDSHGNEISSTAGMSGSSAALESYESIFHQDLNGDGVIGLAVATGATLELNTAHSDGVTFISSTGTLLLDTPSAFTGQITGFTGNGTLAGSDQIDLANFSFNSAVQSSSTYNATTGALTVSNGTATDVLQFAGSYSQANFKFASDGHGGTIVYDPPVTHVTGNSTISGSGGLNNSHAIVDSGATLTLDNVTAAVNTITNNGTVKITDHSAVNVSAGAGQDNFVFAPNFGNATISHYTPGTDALQFDHTLFANMNALLAAIHDDGHGNAVITDAHHDAITLQNVTTAHLLAHQGDFHLI